MGEPRVQGEQHWVRTSPWNSLHIQQQSQMEHWGQHGPETEVHPSWTQSAVNKSPISTKGSQNGLPSHQWFHQTMISTSLWSIVRMHHLRWSNGCSSRTKGVGQCWGPAGERLISKNASKAAPSVSTCQLWGTNVGVSKSGLTDQERGRDLSDQFEIPPTGSHLGH